MESGSVPVGPVLETPDITKAQRIAALIAGVPIVATLLHVFGVYDLSADQTSALEDALQWAALFGFGIVVGDAGIRAGRAIGDTER